jgi:hypothetical protein
MEFVLLLLCTRQWWLLNEVVVKIAYKVYRADTSNSLTPILLLTVRQWVTNGSVGLLGTTSVCRERTCWCCGESHVPSTVRSARNCNGRGETFSSRVFQNIFRSVRLPFRCPGEFDINFRAREKMTDDEMNDDDERKLLITKRNHEKIKIIIIKIII